MFNAKAEPVSKSGFFTASIADSDPDDRRRDRQGARPPAARDRADRVGEHRLQGRARSRRQRADQQVRRRLSRAGATTAAASTSTSSSSSPSTAPRSCSAAASPTCSRTRAARPTRACSTRSPQPGDTILGLSLAAGGHLTHGSPVNQSGKWFKPVSYMVRPDTHRVDMDEVYKLAARASPAHHHRRRLRLSAPVRVRRLPRHRQRGRRLPDGRHGALRRSRRRRPASEPVPACARRHHDDAQDAARPARRHDPDQRRGHRQEDQLGDLPGHPGRPADARHRRQGRGLRRGAASRLQGLRQERHRERQGDGRGAGQLGLRARLRRHRHAS